MHTRLNIPAALPLAAALLGLPACGTQDIDPNNVTIVSDMAGPDKGAFQIAFPQTEATLQAATTSPNSTTYHLMMDGHLMAWGSGNDLTAVTLGEGGEFGAGYLPAGLHHFAVVAPGSTPVFEADGQIGAGGSTMLFLYGALNALGGRFVTMQDTVAAGTEHVVAINLMRSGQAIEVVSCTDASTCTPISPALALGDVFEADVTARDGSMATDSLTGSGAGVGYRLVPSAALPAPPVLSLRLAGSAGVPSYPPPLNFLAAPIFMNDQGEPQMTF